MVLPCNILRDHFVQNPFVTICGMFLVMIPDKVYAIKYPRAPQLSPWISCLCILCHGDFFQYYVFKYHLHADDSQIFITTLEVSPKLQAHISIFTVHIFTFGLNRHITLSQPQTNSLPSLPHLTLPNLTQR